MGKRKRVTQAEGRRQRDTKNYQERQEKERKWGGFYQQEREINKGGKTNI